MVDEVEFPVGVRSLDAEENGLDLSDFDKLVPKDAVLKHLEVKGDGVARQLGNREEAGVKELCFPGLVGDVVDVLVEPAGRRAFADGFPEEDLVAGFLVRESRGRVDGELGWVL